MRKRFNYILSGFFAVLFTLTLHAQNSTEKNIINGEVLIQLKTEAGLQQIIDESYAYGLLDVDLVSERFNIYLLRFNTLKSSNAVFLSSLQENKLIANAQFNHQVSLREINEVVPNDSLFTDQWALENTGQYSGTPGADIHALEAWEFTTGGLTKQGDTIVVAVIDGGCDILHEDLDIWKNRNEIPGNDIDDDENGFIDDVNGWNAFNHTGDIPKNSHGTHVSGIIAAKGDNTIGVTGINWNTKILPVAGESSNEATVVEALSYIYVVREQYDKSNGMEGAFVVGVNSSFGINKGDPANYPIWEAMYDSLGLIGVLNITATANMDWDVDSVGDVPTAFETDYMIAVTNTNNKDEKYYQAAVGKKSIDLGAPGTLVTSCFLNNKYGKKTGTSMASPQVAGAVALLMAAADESFIEAYKEYPAQSALLLKDVILRGVDTDVYFLQETVTEGRLNLFNSINLLLNSPLFITDTDSVYTELLRQDRSYETIQILNVSDHLLQYDITIQDQPAWISMSKSAGTINPGESESIELTFESYGFASGKYNCELTISGVDANTANIPVEMNVLEGVGIETTAHKKSMVSVYPNPFNDAVNFNIRTSDGGDAELFIYKMDGVLVYHHQSTLQTTGTLLKWKTTNLNDGMYFYRIVIDNTETITGKLIRN